MSSHVIQCQTHTSHDYEMIYHLIIHSIDPHHQQKTRAFIKSMMEYEGLSAATANRLQTLLLVYSLG